MAERAAFAGKGSVQPSLGSFGPAREREERGEGSGEPTGVKSGERRMQSGEPGAGNVVRGEKKCFCPHFSAKDSPPIMAGIGVEPSRLKYFVRPEADHISRTAGNPLR